MGGRPANQHEARGGLEPGERPADQNQIVSPHPEARRGELFDVGLLEESAEASGDRFGLGVFMSYPKPSNAVKLPGDDAASINKPGISSLSATPERPRRMASSVKYSSFAAAAS